MAKALLTLEETLALLETVGAKPELIQRFRKQATFALENRNQSGIAIERPPELEPGSDWIEVASGFGQKSHRGFVDLTLNTTRSQLPSAKAREVGLMLLEAAEAATSDEIFVALMDKIGIGLEHAGKMLLDLRELRQGTRGTSWPT